jgi:hypothetical protein
MRKFRFNISLVALFTCIPMLLFSQRGLVNMNRAFDFELESNINQSDSNFHTAIKPYTISSLRRGDISVEKQSSNFFLNKIIDNSYSKKNGLFIVPIISAFGTAQLENKAEFLTDYGAGAYLKGFIGDKFTFNGFYRYVGSNQPSYIDSSLFSQEVIPSVGRATNPGAEILNVNHWEGSLLYDANKYFSFLLGKGKHFWGDGYRSLLLSDNAAAYPYLRIESTFWNVKYVNLYSWHNDFRTGSNRNKFTSSHFLSWNVTKDINLGLFETVVWQGSDTLHNRGFDVSYMNPAIFYRAPEFAMGSSDNSLIGASVKFRIKKKNILYSQVVFDEFYLIEMKAGNKWWANKYGVQVGAKSYDFLGIKNFGVQSEFNLVRPFTYSHQSSLINYGHNNQSLAHSVGANFYELSNFVRYKKGKWYFEAQFNYLEYGEDTSANNYGGDIFNSYIDRDVDVNHPDKDYNHTIRQGEKHMVLYNSLKASYLLIKETNLRAFAQFVYRVDKYNSMSESTILFQIGVSSLIWNEYKDY